MNTDEALQTLKAGGEWPTLAEAIGVVVGDPMISYEALMLGLKYKGLVAEQAAMALYRRSFRPLPDDRRMLVTDPDEWRKWLWQQDEQHAQSEREARGTGYSVREIVDIAKAMGAKPGTIDSAFFKAVAKALVEQEQTRGATGASTKSRRKQPRTRTSGKAGRR